MKKEAGRPRKEKALATKTRLYAAAEALFTQYGFDVVSVDRIVEEAGVAKGTFYVHFESRDSLLETLISDFVERVDVDYQAFIDTFPPDTPAADMLLRLVEKIMDVMVDAIGLARMKALYRAQLANPSHGKIALSYNRRLYKTIMEVLAKGMRRGEFLAELPLEVLANHLILAMRGIIYEWCIRYPDFDLQAQSQAYFRIVLRGMQG